MKNVRDLLYIAMMTTILVILGFIPAIPLVLSLFQLFCKIWESC